MGKGGKADGQPNLAKLTRKKNGRQSNCVVKRRAESSIEKRTEEYILQCSVGGGIAVRKMLEEEQWL